MGIADTDASLSDVDSTNLTSVTVTITNLLDGANEVLAATTGGTSIVANYNSGTGVLTLSGADTVANYQSVLRTVTYDNASQNPTTTARVITFVANDGTDPSNVGTTTVTMVAANDAPVLDLDANDSSGAGGADYATTFTEDLGAVGIADTDASLSDVDSTNLTSVTVTITNLLDGANEVLAATTGGTSIVANYNSGTGVLTLSGADTVANYQSVLRTVTYDNASQNPTTTARVITFVANDGTDPSNVGTTTVTMVAANDAPVLDLDANDSSGAGGADYATTFTEDLGAVGIADTDASLSDVDSTNLTSVTVTITNLLDGANEVLAATTGGTSIVANYNSGTGVLTLSGADTVANYQSVLRTVTYDNASQNPTTTARVITFVANDGTDPSNVGTTTVTMVAANDAPVLDLDANDSSGAGGADYATTFTEDLGAVGIADTDASLSDVDSTNLTSVTVTITNLLDGANEVLAATTGGTSIVANYNSGTGVLTLSGADTVANYQSVLRTVTYDNASQNPTTTARVITFVANDGTDPSNVGTTTVTMVAANDAPVLDLDANDSSGAGGADYATTFTEDLGAVGIADTDASLSDVDSTNLTSVTVTITNLLDGANEVLAATTGGTSIVANYNSGTGVLTLSGADTVANYQSVLRTVTYDNASQNPTTTARVITFVANDGTDPSNVGTTTVTMVAANDAPVLDLDANDSSGAGGADYATTFTEDLGAVGIADTDASLSDVDSTNLTSVTVTITNLLDGANEVLAATTGGTSIVANYNSGTGVLTLSGADTVANYQSVLRTVTYDNASQNPTTTARVITFVANDGTDPSNVGTTTVTMVAANDAPVLDLDANDSSGAGGADYATTFTEDLGAVGIADTDASLSDVDSTNLTSVTVTITNLLDGANEVLAATTGGTSIVANYNSGTGVLTLSGADTVANYQSVLRTVTYDNASQNPTTTARVITFVANDGTDPSNVGTTTVTMVAANDAPVLDLDANDSSGAGGADYATTFTEDLGAVGIADTDASLSDVDSTNLTSVTVTITNLLDGANEVLAATTGGTSIVANYNSGTGVLTLSGADTVANYQSVLRTVTYDNASQNPTTTARVITFVANDGTDPSNVGTTTVTMVAANDAPVLDLDANDSSGAGGADYATTFTEDLGAVGIADTDASLSDVDSTNLTSVTVTITNLLDGANEVLAATTGGTSIVANYNSGTGVLTLSGADTVANYQSVLRTVTYDNASQNPTTTARVITFVANDGTDPSNVGTTTVTMVAANDAPVLDLDANDSSGAGGADYATTFTEDLGAVGIADTDASLSDVDSTNLTSVTVTITNLLDGANEVLAATTGGTSIVANYNSGTGVLTLSGADTVANYQSVLRTVTYDNASQNPTTTARVITFVANDGTDPSNVGTTTVTMVAANDAPVLDLDANDSSGAGGADYATTFTEDLGAVGIADTDASLSDVDSTNLTSVTVTITNLLDGANEVLAATTGGTSIVANYNSGTGVLTLSGADTVANYQSVLRTVTYDNASQNPTTTARVITFVANDGTDPSNVGTTTVTMVAANDAPVLDLDANDSSGAGGADYATTFTEDLGAVGIADTDASLSDVDSTNLTSVTVTITNLLDGANEVLAATTGGTSIVANYNSGTGVLTLSGADTVANYQSVLRTVTYDNASQNPTTTARVITFVANDGTDPSNVGTTTVTMVAANDAPVLDLDANDSSGAGGADYATTFTEDLGAVGIADTDASLSDVDSTNLTSVTVTITNLLDGANEVLAATTGGTSIVANYNSGTGVLTLSGADTVANYQSVLRTVTYDNASQNPTTTARVITFVANDGTDPSNVGTTTVTMVAANDAPVLDLDANDSSGAGGADYATTFTEDLGAVGIADTDASLSDVDSTNLTSVTVTITNLLDGANEVLAATTGGTSIVANYNSGTGVLTLSGADTVANYQSVLRTVTYDNASQNPTTTARVITFVANDGTDPSNVGTTTVTMVAANDAPIATDDPGDFNSDIGGLTPVGYWRLGEPSGTTAVDVGSAANDGTYNGVTLGQAGALTGDLNTAVRFNGSTDYLEIAHNPSYLLDNGSVQLWFNVDSIGSDQTLFSKDSTGFDTGGHLNIRILASGQLEVRLQSTSTGYILTSASSVTATAWHHVAFTFGSSGMALYLDGQVVGTDIYTGGLGTSSGGSGNFEPIAIGAGTMTSGNLVVTPLEEFFTGSIDEVAIFGSQLNAETIQDLYAAGLQFYTIAEDSAIAVTANDGVLSNDFDADGDSLTASVLAGPSNAASFTLNADGSFSYTPVADFNGVDTFTYQVSDGNGGMDTGTASITVTPVNDIPVITNLGGDTLNYTEGDGAQVIDQSTNAVVSDVDMGDFDMGTLTVSFQAGSDVAEDVLAIRNQGTGVGQIGVSGANVTYQGTTIGTFTGGSGGTNLVITLNTAADATAVTALVRNITYENTDTANPTTGSRMVRYVLTDGDGGTSANYDTTVTFTAVNDDPVNAGTLPTDISVTEDVSSNVDLSAIDLNDVDASGGSLTVTLTTNTGGNLTAITGGGVIVGGSGTGTVTLTGTLGNLNTFLNTASNITYLHGTANTNGNDADTIQVDVTDNGNTGSGGGGTINLGTVNVDITPVNDLPVITNLGGDTLNYTEGDGAVVIDQSTNAGVSDVDSSDFDTGTLTVSFTAGSDPAEDVLAIRNQGTGAGQIGVSGANVTYQGTTIGAFTGGSGGTNLVITLNSNADATAVSALVQNITYENTDTTNPTTSSRTVRYVLTDGDGGTSANYDTTVTVSRGNNAPVITSNGSGTTATVFVAENQLTVTTVTATDVDLPVNTLSFAIVGGVDQGLFSLDSVSGALTFVAAPDFENPADANSDGVYEVTVQVDDGNGGTDFQTINVTVTDVPESQPPPLPDPDPDTDPAPEPKSDPVTDPETTATTNVGEGSISGMSSEAGGLYELTKKQGSSTGKQFDLGFLDLSRHEVDLNDGDHRWLDLEEIAVATRNTPFTQWADTPVSDALLSRLDALAQDLENAMQEATQRQDLIARVATGTSLTLSAGFVAWLLRGGSLLSSLIAVLPAWRFFDPLPVVGANKRERQELAVEERRARRAEEREFKGLRDLFSTSSRPSKPTESDKNTR